MSSREKNAPEPVENLDGRAASLARDLLRQVENGECMSLSHETIQDLTGALCRIFAARQESGDVFPILGPSGATGTDVMVLCSALLKAADLQVFELGMWTSWTGR